MLILTAFPHRLAVDYRGGSELREALEVRDSWLDSHFGWQIRTFWYAFLWLLAGGVAFVTVIGIPVALVVWVLYRIARGWMTLAAEKPMPQPE